MIRCKLCILLYSLVEGMFSNICFDVVFFVMSMYIHMYVNTSSSYVIKL